jgi:predicted amidohydrolase
VIAPDGTITAMIDGGDGFTLADMDLDAARARCIGGEAVFAQRRPELYAGLLSDTFSWNPRDFFKLNGHKPWPPGQTSRVTVAQMSPSNDVESTLACITSLARQAKLEERADLVVFPELALSGLTDRGARAQAVPGPVTDRLCRLAAQLKMYLVAGVAERDRDAVYNSACLIGPVAVYRKTHLIDSERAWASPGDAWVVADTPVGRIGLLIGHDASFPEAGRILALRGCDLILCPAAMKERFSGPHPGSLGPQNYPIPTGADPYHWITSGFALTRTTCSLRSRVCSIPPTDIRASAACSAPTASAPRSHRGGHRRHSNGGRGHHESRHRLSDQRRASERSGRDAGAARVDQEGCGLTRAFRE